MAIIKLNNNALTSVTALPSGVGADPNVKTDLARLGLRVFANQNLVKQNSNSASYDVFQDSTGVTNLTNCARTSEEYIGSIYTDVSAFTSDSDTAILLHMEDNSDSSSGTDTLSLNGNASFSTAQAKFGSKSLFCSSSGNGFGNITAGNRWQVGTGALTVECWGYGTNKSGVHQSLVGKWTGGNVFDMRYEASDASGNFGLHDQTTMRNSGQSSGLNGWHHFAWTRDGSSNNTLWYDGVSKVTWTNNNNMNMGTNSFYLGQLDGSVEFDGYIDEVRISTVSRYSSAFTPNSSVTANASGSFEGATITAGSSTSKMGAVITYQNNAGTNALNSDLILKLSADNGSNYSTATLTALPDFASGVKCCQVSDLSVTAGTQLKYKIEFANQSSGSKECRVTGVSLQY